jgi:hypothetical protein
MLANAPLSFAGILASLSWRYTLLRVILPAGLVSVVWYLAASSAPTGWLFLVAFLVEHIRSRRGRARDAALQVSSEAARRVDQHQGSLDEMINANGLLAKSRAQLFWTRDVPSAVGYFGIAWLLLIGLVWLVFRAVGFSEPVPLSWVGVIVLGVLHALRLLTLAATISGLAAPRSAV